MKTQNIIKAIAILFTLFICFIIYSANTGSNLIFFRVIGTLPYGDKLAHTSLIGLLAFILNLATNGQTTPFYGKKWLVVSLIMIPLVTIEEFSQIFIASRSFDLLDLLGNYTGIALASWAILKMKGKSFFSNLNSLSFGE
jgi:hypothetical protein